ncbi:hypothetical protein EDC04DRAFT_3088269 [Pisolithus marmoratus]|nr:hypothetical protein EDC04DRAFT_3088269 [Pisolithus marmoratus]
MVTQRQQSGSTISDGRTTPENDETSGVPSMSAPKVGDTLALERTSASFCTKPDKVAFQAEEARIKSEIDAVQTKLTAVCDNLSSSYANRPDDAVNNKRVILRAELDHIRRQRSGRNNLRQIKSLQDSIDKRNSSFGLDSDGIITTQVKNLQAAKAKPPFRTVAEVEARTESLKKQIKSRSMRVVEEGRATRELLQLACLRKTVEVFQCKEDAIEADRRAVDELRKRLEDPESKVLSDRHEAITAELDGLKREIDEFYAGRARLIQERNALQAQLNALWREKRDASQKFRDASDRYWAKMQEYCDYEDCQFFIHARSGKSGSIVVLAWASPSAKVWVKWCDYINTIRSNSPALLEVVWRPLGYNLCVKMIDFAGQESQDTTSSAT